MKGAICVGTIYMLVIAVFAGCAGSGNKGATDMKINNLEANLEPKAPPKTPIEVRPNQQGCAIEKTTVVGEDPIESYVLQNEYLYVTVMKEWGAKIYNCIYKPTGHDFVWKNEYGRLMNPQKEKSRTGPIWMKYEIGGFDDCMPGVGECDYKGVHIPDHGESWLCQWNVTDTQNKLGFVSITMECTLRDAPFKIAKTITLFKSQSRYLRHYSITNIGKEEWPFCWGDHASITPGGAINTGDRMFLPEKTKLIVYYSKDNRLGPQGTILDWPIAAQADGKETDLSVMGPKELCYADKLFTTELPEGWLAAGDPQTKEILAFSFPADVMPYGGIWIDQGGHRGYQQIAIEATNGIGDAITECVEKFKKFSALKPGETCEFDIWTSVARGIDNVRSVSPGGTFVQEKIKMENGKISGKIIAPLKGSVEILYTPVSGQLGALAQPVARYDCTPESVVALGADAVLPGIYSVRVLDGEGSLVEELARFSVEAI